MHKNFYFYGFFLSVIILCSMSIKSMEHKTRKHGNTLIRSIKADMKKLIQEQTPKENVMQIEEIESPSIIQEKQQRSQTLLNNIIKGSDDLDKFIATLSSQKQVEWNIKQSSLLEPYKIKLAPIIRNNIKNKWQRYGKEIVQFSSKAALAGITSALISFMYQSAKIGTGNLKKLSTNELIISALTSLSANLIASSSKFLFKEPVTATALTAESTNILEQAIITPSIRSKDYGFTISPKGLIKSWIIGEGIATVNTMLTNNNEIAQVIKNINVKQVLVGKKIGSTSNALVTTVLPQMQSIISNEKLALVLTEVGWICFQSAAVGGLLWAAGLGYSGTSITGSMNSAMALGMTQGTLTNLAALMNKTTPGAVLTIACVPLSQQIAAITDTSVATTAQAALTGVFQAITTQATNFIIDESEKYGGLWQTLQKGKLALGAALSLRWSSIWCSLMDALATIQEIEPLSL